MISKELQEKIDKSIKIIKMGYKNGGGNTVEVAFSGGKDSEVILQLTKMSGIDYKAIYRNTTIDPPGTVQHCKNKGVEIKMPKESFLHLVTRKGFPTRRCRFCCEFLKEYKVMDNCIQGIRRCESTSRQNRYDSDEPIICRIYGSKKNKVNVILPILDWTDEDVEQFIEHYNIQCHPLYYDEAGKFHVERRLGCIGCPIEWTNGKKSFLKYPLMLKAWLRSAKIWWNKPREKPMSSQSKFKDIYHLAYNNLFCSNYDQYLKVADKDLKKELEDYFGIDLTV